MRISVFAAVDSRVYFAGYGPPEGGHYVPAETTYRT